MSALIAKCPLCGASAQKHQPYLNNMSKIGKIFGRAPFSISLIIPFKNIRNRFVHGIKVVQVFKEKYWFSCAECDLGFTVPALTREELSDYYSTNFWSIRNSLDLESVIYDKENLERPAQQLAFLNKNGLEEVSSMLDFGAGMCGAAALFRKENFCSDITVLDPSSQAEQIASILGVNHIKSFGQAENTLWDFIYSSHSLEHVPDVREIMDNFYKLAKSRGYLFIEVPNIANSTVLKEAHHAPHTYCFSEKSLIKAAKCSGFELIQAVQYGETYQSRMSKQNSSLRVPESLMALFRRVD